MAFGKKKAEAAQATPPLTRVIIERSGPHPARVALWVFIFVALYLAGTHVFPWWVALVWIVGSLLILARLRH